MYDTYLFLYYIQTHWSIEKLKKNEYRWKVHDNDKPNFSFVFEDHRSCNRSLLYFGTLSRRKRYITFSTGKFAWKTEYLAEMQNRTELYLDTHSLRNPITRVTINTDRCNGTITIGRIWGTWLEPERDSTDTRESISVRSGTMNIGRSIMGTGGVALRQSDKRKRPPTSPVEVCVRIHSRIFDREERTLLRADNEKIAINQTKWMSVLYHSPSC